MLALRTRGHIVFSLSEVTWWAWGFGGRLAGLGARWMLSVSILMWRSAALGCQGPHPVGCTMETLCEDPDVALGWGGFQGADIVYSAEVRVARLTHCWDCVWNPGYGYRLFRGGEGRKTHALLGLRLESRALGYGIAHGVGRTMDALSEYPDVALGCAGVSGTTSRMAYNGCSQ
jgi:hypothetical protein